MTMGHHQVVKIVIPQLLTTSIMTMEHKNITNSPADNDTRYFEEKINPMIGTTRVSFGIGLNFLEGTWVGVGTRYGVSLGLAQV